MWREHKYNYFDRSYTSIFTNYNFIKLTVALLLRKYVSICNWLNDLLLLSHYAILFSLWWFWLTQFN